MYYKSPLTYLLALAFIFLLFLNLNVVKENQFVELAKSFKDGSLSVNRIHNASDMAIYNGKYYWPLGPFPAVMILPFLYISKHFIQGYISFALIILDYFLLYKLARFLSVEHKKSILLATFFIFGSIYTPLAALPAPWYLSQTIACSFLILAILEFLKKKGYLLTGVYLAFSIATRATLIFTLPFFIYLILKGDEKIPSLIKFSIPIAICLLLLGTYNQARFNNPLEQGYSHQLIPSEPQLRRNEGLFSLKHIPANLYYMLLSGPEPVLKDESHVLKPPYVTFNSYGLSLFFMSPILFLVYRARIKSRLNIASLLAISATLVPLLTYYGIGQKQVGYRYALDFFPFVYLLVADAARKINYKLMTILVFWGVFFSLFFTFLYFTGQEH